MNGLHAIAIDGPSGAGKSTMAREAAKRFGFLYVDTGAMYRTVGLAAFRAGLDSKDRDGVAAMLPSLDITMAYDGGGVQRMYLGGLDVSEEIRAPEASIYASDVSAMPEVRAYLLERQRSLARQHSVIMDGRDIGTVVLPGADVKIFLTASPETRARRRYMELLEKGKSVTEAEVLRDMLYRDENDSGRACAPLRAADDAVTLDTGRLTLEESIEAVCSLIEDSIDGRQS